MQLWYNNTLSTVDNEGTIACHVRYCTEEHVRTDVLEELRMVSNSASTLYKYGFEEGYDKEKKKALDNILKKFLIETDKFGNIFADEEIVNEQTRIINILSHGETTSFSVTMSI